MDKANATGFEASEALFEYTLTSCTYRWCGPNVVTETHADVTANHVVSIATRVTNVRSCR